MNKRYTNGFFTQFVLIFLSFFFFFLRVLDSWLEKLQKFICLFFQSVGFRVGWFDFCSFIYAQCPLGETVHWSNNQLVRLENLLSNESARRCTMGSKGSRAAKRHGGHHIWLTRYSWPCYLYLWKSSAKLSFSVIIASTLHKNCYLEKKGNNSN